MASGIDHSTAVRANWARVGAGGTAPRDRSILPTHSQASTTAMMPV
jgi:hypothetical protein